MQAIKEALSPGRMSTYEIAAGNIGNTNISGFDLYIWNAQISGAFMTPLHICEVVLRNAVADAVEGIYGASWPWALGFEQSLPGAQVGYSPQKDLVSSRKNFTATGKVIPELKFVFWQKMFTSRHDERIWKNHLLRVMPGLDTSKTVRDLRKLIYDDLEEIRKLRNRIAHHEPIFSRNLAEDFDRITQLITFRSQETANWMLKHQQVQELIKNKS